LLILIKVDETLDLRVDVGSKRKS